MGPVCPVLLPCLSANRAVGINEYGAAAAVFPFQVLLTSFSAFTLPAAYSAKEKITSQKKSQQGQQPREGMTSNPTIFPSKLTPNTPTLWGVWGVGHKNVHHAPVDHFSRTNLRHPGRLQLILCVIILTATLNTPSSLF